MTDTGSVLHLCIKITGVLFIYMAVTGSLGVGITAPIDYLFRTVNGFGMRFYRLQDDIGVSGVLVAFWLLASAVIASRFER